MNPGKDISNCRFKTEGLDFLSVIYLLKISRVVRPEQKYSRLGSLLRVKVLVFCFYLGCSGSILQFRQNMIKVGSKSWLLTYSSNITLSSPSYTGSALKRQLKFCNGYLSLLYFWTRVSVLHAQLIRIYRVENLF